MCAIIGVYLQNPSQDDFDLIRRVFVESKIRGLHATGMSFINKENKLITVKESLPADEFVEKHLTRMDDILCESGDICLIGHCRYSTSDLEYNQPIANDSCSIVHNGVISQEFPEKWESLYGYACETKNDSELVLKSPDPLSEFNHMSMGVCKLTKDKKLQFFRNGKRPVYLSSVKNGYIITSTADIVLRAGLKNAQLISMNHYYTVDENLILQKSKIEMYADDLQKELKYGI